jgi:eukaryotic-like serine/threonine-protein kinase
VFSVATVTSEQLEGKEADTRTDIFALGEVIYEMATGQIAFEGKSHASLIAAILDREPPPISALRSMTPPTLDHIVQTCMVKDPDGRWQTVHDVLVELRWLAEGSQAGASSQLAATTKRHQVLVPLLSVVLVTVSVAFVLLAMVHLREMPAEVHPIRWFRCRKR